MARASATRAVIADPIYGMLDFGTDQNTKDLVKSILAKSEFQRLRRISQLGLASYIYPGATHTRFSHSLGAAHLARLVTRHLREWFPDEKSLEQREGLILAAALLHDIGHGPFSHSFERVLGKALRVTHEEWTAAIIRERFAHLGEHVDLAALHSMFEAKTKLPPAERWLKQIVSSQLDVDRMDYLVRDAHYAGVSLGRIDIGYLISNLVMVQHGTNVRSLGVTPKGVRPYEAFAMARHFMNRSVYFHPKVRVFEVMMEACLREIVHSLRDSARRKLTAPALIRRLSSVFTTDDKDRLLKTGVEGYLELTEDKIWVMLSTVAEAWPDSRARFLAHSLLTRAMVPHLRLKQGMGHVAKEVLEQFSSEVEVVDLSSTVYAEKPGESVFVAGDENEDIRRHSFAISVNTGRAEVDTLLVVLNPDRAALIERLMGDAHCLAHRSGSAGPAIRATRPSDEATKLTTSQIKGSATVSTLKSRFRAADTESKHQVPRKRARHPR